MVIKNISIYVINCDISWDMRHNNIMKTLQSSISTDASGGVAPGTTPGVLLYYV